MRTIQFLAVVLLSLLVPNAFAQGFNNDDIAYSTSSNFAGFNISCNGGNDGSITLTLTGSTEPYAFIWNNGATTQNLAGLTAGTYTVVVTDANSSTATQTIDLTEPTPLVLDAGNDTFVFYGMANPQECVTLTAVASGGVSVSNILIGVNNGYFFQNSNFPQESYSVEVCPQSDTDYPFEVKDGLGCTAEATVLVRAYNISCGNNNDKIQVCINGSQTVCLTQNAASNVLANNPNAMLGSCEAYNKQMPGATGAMDVSIAPNPSRGRFTLSFYGLPDETASIQVCDKHGRVVLFVPLSTYDAPFQTDIDLTSHPDGIYFIRVLGANSVLHTGKVVKLQ